MTVLKWRDGSTGYRFYKFTDHCPSMAEKVSEQPTVDDLKERKVRENREESERILAKVPIKVDVHVADERSK